MNLFSPLRLGALELRNRIIMAPMTRGRADENAVPTAEMVDYYRQRASAGLIISEGIAPSAEGLGYCRTPGLFNDYQTSAWRKVTAAVHGEGGLIAAQIMHVGRVASHYNKPADSDTVSPSALTARGEMYTDEKGMQPFDSPRALQFDEISRVIADYQRATENAFAAGFDAVELHCTSGYLPAQFLSSGTNQRTDAYGGSVENRVRFVLEVLDAMASVRGSDRVGIRICPDNPFNDLSDEDPEQTFDTLLKEAGGRGLAYLHSIRMPAGRVDNIGLGQRYFGDCLIANESYSFEEAQSQVESAAVTAVSFGRPFIANPDLVARWQNNIALANFDPGTLYTPGSAGYSDYPSAHA